MKWKSTVGSELFGGLGKSLDFRVTINAMLGIIHRGVCRPNPVSSIDRRRFVLAFPMIRMHGVVSVHDFPLLGIFSPGAGSFEIFALVSSFVQRLTNDVSRMESHLWEACEHGPGLFQLPLITPWPLTGTPCMTMSRHHRVTVATD